MSKVDAGSLLDRLGAFREAMTVGRVFGESYRVDDVTIIPVAVVRGGGGGGTGSNVEVQPGDEPSRFGGGFGFGVNVRPVGIVVVKDGQVTWQPTIDVMRVIVGGQLLALAAILTVRRLLRR
jgi:uncharacterized spore protein YtfJ